MSSTNNRMSDGFQLLSGDEGRQKSRRGKAPAEEILQIKEFDVNSMPPHSVSDKNGVKIVVIGKPGCFAPGFSVMMWDGKVKKVEDVRVGDLLMGDDNEWRTVLKTHHDWDLMYRVQPVIGESYTVNQNHVLVVKHKRTGEVREISVNDFLLRDDQDKWQIFKAGVVDFPEAAVDIEPYLVGCYLMDGILPENKVLADAYLRNSRDVREKVMTGVLDNFSNIASVRGTKVETQILFLARSLGYMAEIVDDQLVMDTIGPLHCDFSLVPVGMGEFFGFELDGNRRFLSGEFDVCRNTGKSTIIQSIVAAKSHILTVSQIFSGTEDSNHFYSTHFPPICIYNKLDFGALKNFIIRQKIAKQFLPNPWGICIVDDCTDNVAMLRDPIMQNIYKNGRHFSCWFLLSLQYCLDVLPSIRTNIDYTFILRETNLRNRKALYENFAGAIESFQLFCEIMDAVTEDYTALVINNRVQSNKIEDCVFWYRADPNSIPSNWRFGHPSAWEFSNDRMDPSYNDINTFM
jgi:hypothetical protein